MPTFSSTFQRPGVYVKQTTATSAAALPTSFSAAFIGHGSDRYTITYKAIVSTGASTQVLDTDRNVVSISSVSYNNTDITSAATLANVGNIPFGSCNITFSGTIPAENSVFYVTYVAYKNPATDFKSYEFTEFADFLSFYGAPSASVSEVINGVYTRNNMSLAAYIASRHGAGVYYGQQLNAFDESTSDTATAMGTSVSAATPGTTVLADVTLTLAINGEDAKTITLAANTTGLEIAADIQAKVRALAADDPALKAAYENFTCAYTTVYTLTSGMAGSNSAVVVSGGTAAATLKLGLTNSGVETAGTGPTYLDLTSDAGMLTSVTQALGHLILPDVWALVPLFPLVSGGINTSIISVIKNHVVTVARSVTERKLRVALMGAQRNTDVGASPQTKYITTQAVLADKALCYIAPSTSVYTYGGVDYTMDGWGVASAIAGIVTNPSYDAGEPISGKELIGFTSISDPFTGTQKTLMGTAGVLMVDSLSGTPAILMDLTTDQTSNVRSQLKFTKSGDYVAKSLQLILHKLFINTRNVGASTLAAIKNSTKMILQQLAALHIINDFADLTVAKNGIDARQIDITVSVQLVPDVSWIYITLNLSL